ncbi:MAG: AbfB domain-containing protein [Polyangiales bacterium]
MEQARAATGFSNIEVCENGVWTGHEVPPPFDPGRTSGPHGVGAKPPASASPAATTAPLLGGPTVSLQSVNFPDRYVRHCSGLGFIDRNDKTNPACDPAVFKQDVTFRRVSGLAGGASVSFESVNYPGTFLRHQNGRIKLATSDATSLFKQDASFHEVAGLAGSGTSFQSVNFPDRYLRHCSGKLFIDRNDGTNADCATAPDVYAKDVSFLVVPGLYKQ